MNEDHARGDRQPRAQHPNPEFKLAELVAFPRLLAAAVYLAHVRNVKRKGEKGVSTARENDLPSAIVESHLQAVLNTSGRCADLHQQFYKKNSHRTAVTTQQTPPYAMQDQVWSNAYNGLR
jgi:hypothetical protein